MEFQCFEVKPEDACPQGDKPSTDMFTGSGKQFLFLCTAFALTFQWFYFQTKFTMRKYQYTYPVLKSNLDDIILWAVKLFVLANPV